MARIIMLILAMSTCAMACAETFSYRFNSTPLPEAIQRIMENHPDIVINFIYNELENYTTSADVGADNAFDAIRQAIGLNPVTVVKSKNTYYVEALQHGLYTYTGRLIGKTNEPVVAATVMLLAPQDSTVITYGITDDNGRFSIPCDRTNVIAKLSCLGYMTTYRRCNSFNVGTIIMPEHAVALETVTVEGDNARMYSDHSTYIPTQRQKNASQTGDELLSHMAIPQLGLIYNGKITTSSGKSVAVFIDHLPASENDLKAMRVKDVRKVEYYTYPSDPRFQGKQYVVNFIMQQYEYGGYVKGFGHFNLISYSEQILGSTRFQRNKMKYDLMGYGWNMNSSHYGSDLTESFRLPQPDGSIKEFDRYSHTTSSTKESQQYLIAFRATYTSDKALASTEIDGGINRDPHSDEDGCVTYTSGVYPVSEYTSRLKENSRFITYSGHYYFEPSENNSITFTPAYTFSHTERNSAYKETTFAEIFNSAVDNTNELTANLTFNQQLGSYGNIKAFVRGNYEYNRTRYTGSVSSMDKAKSVRLGGGATYSINKGNVYGLLGFGYDWDRLTFKEIDDKTASPWIDFSIQYSIRDKHTLSTTFHYSTWQPSSNFKSNNIIISSPFMKYTGNPNLNPYTAYDLGVDYAWIPNNRFNLGSFAYGWVVDNRYVFDYVPNDNGIIRTIKQPLGKFAQLNYGVNATARFLDNSFVITAQIAQALNHNGAPYDQNHTIVYWHARVLYYLRNWNVSLTYISDNAKAESSKNGFWNKSQNDWQLSIGWSDDHWNLKANIINFTRWKWNAGHREMNSNYYSIREQLFNGSNHALVQLSATYTFGYGKKVRQDNEPSVSGSAASGILK